MEEQSREGQGAVAGELLQRMGALGVPYGREDSFKLVPGGLLRGRLLIGVPVSSLTLEDTLAVGSAFGMPEGAQHLVTCRFREANAVFFATEESTGHQVFKVYLEFWEVVRARVRSGDASPQLLHFGVKWDSARGGHFEQAHYTCVPLLNTRDVLHRMRAVLPPQAPEAAVGIAQDMVRLAASRSGAPFLYMDVSETGNPRRSFDVNLYKSGLVVADAAPQLAAAAAHFDVAGDAFDTMLAGMRAMPLGHVAAGLDRRGVEFLSIYAEVAPLPEA
jgi:hypothetical protein